MPNPRAIVPVPRVPPSLDKDPSGDRGWCTTRAARAVDGASKVPYTKRTGLPQGARQPRHGHGPPTRRRKTPACRRWRINVANGGRAEETC